MICFHRFCELAFLEEAVSWWQRETEIVYFVNVIDAKLQKAAAILLAGGRPDKTRAGQIRAKTTAAAKAETFSWQAVGAPAPHSYCSRAQELVCTALTWHDSGPGLYITQPVLHGIANRQKAGAQFNLQKLWPASREGDKSRTPLTTLALWRDISNLPWISLPRSSPNNLQPCKQLSTAAAAVVCWRTANSCDLRPFCSNGAIKCDISEIQIQNVAVMSSHGRPARHPEQNT